MTPSTTTVERDFASFIKRFGLSGITRIQRLGAAETVSVLSLAADAAAPVETYLAAAGRVAASADPLARAELRAADAGLRPFVTALPQARRDVLLAELDHRANLVLNPTNELEAAAAEEAGRTALRGKRTSTSALVALTQRRLVDRIRELARKPVLALVEAETLAGYRLLTAVLGDEWNAAWEAAYTYLAAHAESLRLHIARLKQATAAAAAAGDSGFAATAAQAELDSARSAFGGQLSNLRGAIFEAYVSRWDGWLKEVNRVMRLAEQELAKLPAGWRVTRVVGGMRLNGKLVWDEAILLVEDGGQRRARLFMAAELKNEGTLSAPDQILRAITRENEGTRAGLLTIDAGDGVPQPYNLVPAPPDAPPLRYIVNASGGALTKNDAATLARTGISVLQMNADLTRSQLTHFTDYLVMALVAE